MEDAAERLREVEVDAVQAEATDLSSLDAERLATADRELRAAYRRQPADPALLQSARRLAAETTPALLARTLHHIGEMDEAKYPDTIICTYGQGDERFMIRKEWIQNSGKVDVVKTKDGSFGRSNNIKGYIYIGAARPPRYAHDA